MQLSVQDYARGERDPRQESGVRCALLEDAQVSASALEWEAANDPKQPVALIAERSQFVDFHMPEEEKISIEYPGGTDIAAYVTFVGPNEARLETDPMSCLFTEDEDELKSLPDIHDVIELDEIEPRKYRFVRVSQRARLQRFEFLLSDPEAQTKALEPVLSRVIELGGNWERVFGGVLTMFLPRDCQYDPSEDVQRTLAASSQE